MAGNAGALTEAQQATVEAVLKSYGEAFILSGLSDLTHSEAPWADARRGLQPGDRGHAEITHAALVEYYGGLDEHTATALG